MSEIRIPDIGGATDVDVIELLVSVGDEISEGQSLITLESDKASMEIPSPSAGKVEEMKVALGDKVSEGDLILLLASTEQTQDKKPKISEPEKRPIEKEETTTSSSTPVSQSKTTTTQSSEETLYLPDLGTTDAVDVIEITVAVGDNIEKDQAVLTLEGDKASMEIPSPMAGTVKALLFKVGDKVKQGDAMMRLAVTEKDISVASTSTQNNDVPAPTTADIPAGRSEPNTETITQSQTEPSEVSTTNRSIYAGPAVRRLAREFGVALEKVKGSGKKGRIIPEDVQNYVKQIMKKAGSAEDTSVSHGFALPSAPKIDFAQFGEIEEKPLNKIKKLTASHLHRNWVTIPHVTQFDEADITELERFRKEHKQSAEKQGFKLTPLVFIMKAVVRALQEYPQFNASLSVDGQSLIYKKYFHVGVAVDTPNGLVVPVIRDVDRKGLMVIAKELAAISQKARDTGLGLGDMQGGCFTISSLGGIGGTAFTPIINAPDVAILGVSRANMQPVFIDGKFRPRLILPLSLSYDHRVIDGAEAARFTRFLSDCISDIRNIIL